MHYRSHCCIGHYSIYDYDYDYDYLEEELW